MQKRTAQPGLAVRFGLGCSGATSRGGNPRATECSLILAGRLGLSNPNAPQERDRRSQIGSQETGRELTPTVPGGHAKGSNCAARKRASSQRPSLRRRARRPLVKIRSAAIAGHEWTVSFHAEGSEHRLIPEPRLEGGISGVRGMPRDGGAR
jgi:hypothetical protein